MRAALRFGARFWASGGWSGEDATLKALAEPLGVIHKGDDATLKTSRPRQESFAKFLQENALPANLQADTLVIARALEPAGRAGVDPAYPAQIEGPGISAPIEALAVFRPNLFSAAEYEIFTGRDRPTLRPYDDARA